MTMKLGDAVYLSDEEKATYLKSFQDRLRTAREAWWEIADEVTAVRKLLFDTVRERHPELADVQFSLSNDGMCIVISRPGEKEELA